MMSTGTVKFSNTDKGHGFLAPEDSGADGFGHAVSVPSAGWITAAHGAAGLLGMGVAAGPMAACVGVLGVGAVIGSFALPNGDRISTVRKDVMDRALGRDQEHTNG